MYLKNKNSHGNNLVPVGVFFRKHNILCFYEKINHYILTKQLILRIIKNDYYFVEYVD